MYSKHASAINNMEKAREDTECIEVDYELVSHLPSRFDEEHRKEAESVVGRILGEYAESGERRALCFPSQLNSEVRQVVHNVAESLNLVHKSKGPKNARTLIVSKPVNIPIVIDKGKKLAGAFYDVPDPVKEIWLENITDNSLLLKWKQPDCNGFPITAYKVTVEHPSRELLLNSAKEELLVQNLEPNTQYSVRVLAENSEGEGYAGSEFKCRTLRGESEAGELFVWGYMAENILPFKLDGGEAPKGEVIRPTVVKELGDGIIEIKALTTGIGLFADGSVFRFGAVVVHDEDASESQKQRPYFTDDKDEKMTAVHSEPYQLTLPPKGKTFIANIACGDMFVLGLTATGEIISWGANSFGELGIGTAISCTYAVEPFAAKFPPCTFVTQVAAGASHAIALTDAAEVFVWGKCRAPYYKDYEEDCLFTISQSSSQSEPRMLKKTDLEGKAVSVHAGGEISGIINDREELLLFGDNDMCQLGLGEELKGHFHIPRLVDAFKKENNRRVKSVSIGAGHVLAIVHEPAAKVYSWGHNKKGQCGHAGKNTIPHPTPVPGTEDVVEVAAGAQHSLFRDKGGSVWACGDASRGATGLTSELKGRVTSVKRLANVVGKKCVKVAAGANSSFALMKALP